MYATFDGNFKIIRRSSKLINVRFQNEMIIIQYAFGSE